MPLHNIPFVIWAKRKHLDCWGFILLAFRIKVKLNNQKDLKFKKKGWEKI
jgi:hypothetical protein